VHSGKTLIQHSVDEALGSLADEVIVIVKPDVQELKGEGTIVVVNEGWEEGMASSVRCGLNAISEKTKQVILMMCDQPFVNAALLDSLVKVQAETEKKIIACSFADTFGPPALFHHSLFPELRELNGDVGARKVVERHAEEVITIPFQNGEVDIDEEKDYENLIGKNDQ
jgi:molybdenum cofactor cytidylyltransferase